MARDVQVVVVGAGVAGLATAWALARSGCEVLVLEQFEVGHARGSSHGHARIFRLVYDDPHYVRLAQRALPLWRELEDETGRALLRTTGSIELGPGLEERRRALEACGVEFEVVSAAEVCARHPLRLPDDLACLAQADGGVLDAEAAQLAFLDSAWRRGARLLEGTRAEAVEDGDDAAVVRAGGRELEADAVVVAAGAWVNRLLEPLGRALPVVVTRETVAYFPLEADGLPSLVDWRAPPGRAHATVAAVGSVYALTSPEGLKVGVHRAGHEADPDEVGGPDPEVVGQAAEWVERHCPTARPEPLRSETCLYTNMPDESFVLECRGRVVVGSPCSGHGFKFAPAVGERLAELALGA
jgi:sarcosine oxidase